MYKHVLKDQVPLRTALHWFMLAFLAGSVNAGGFLACGRFVTHVTGFAAHFGVDLVEGRYWDALGIVVVPVFFTVGALISGVWVDGRIHRRQVPRYDVVMLFSGLCLLASAVGGEYDLFGTFGQTLRINKDFILLVLLCTASGLQNAAITTASKGTVRTTHLTGLSTDLGIGLAKLLATHASETETYRRRVRTQMIRAGTIGSYIAGSVGGAWLFLEAHYLGFLFPAALAFYAGFIAWREEFGRFRSRARVSTAAPAISEDERVYATETPHRRFTR